MRTDCFACVDNGCRVLVGASCEGCKFYKTEKQYNEDRLKAKRTLAQKYKTSYEQMMLIKGYKRSE